MDEKTANLVPALLNELIINMKGLRKEIEAWRIHTSSGGSFILDVLDKQTGVIEEIKAALK